MENANDPRDAGPKLQNDELNQMSVKDRERVFEDIHGVSAEVVETPELVETGLLLLEQQVNSISNKNAYNLAATQNWAYVNDRKLRLMFLRAERFDATKAANRMVGFFQVSGLVQWLDASSHLQRYSVSFGWRRK